MGVGVTLLTGRALAAQQVNARACIDGHLGPGEVECATHREDHVAV
jgi:hypothetical protein